MTDYSLENYGAMFLNTSRHQVYVEALERSVKPGDIVCDIGTGVGIYAFLAARLGAKRVYAIEPNPAVNIGRRIAEANGLADQIEFIQGFSTDLELPEKADVIISDLRGWLPLYGLHLPTLRDARERLLAPDGVLLPQRDDLYAALAFNPRGASDYLDVWLTDHDFDLDLSLVADEEANVMRQDEIRRDHLLSEPNHVATIDYTNGLDETDVFYEGRFAATTDGLAHGICVWFDATILDDLGYSAGPGAPSTVYGMAFMPFARPVEVQPGTDVDVAISARLHGEEYIWQWSAQGTDRHGNPFHYDHGTFDNIQFDLAAIHRRKASHRVPQNVYLEIDSTVLDLLATGQSLGEVADHIVERHPTVVGDRNAALTRVADLAERYAT